MNDGNCPTCGKLVPQVPLVVPEVKSLDLFKVEFRCPDCGSVRYTPNSVNEMPSLDDSEKKQILDRVNSMRPGLKDGQQVIVVSSYEYNPYDDQVSFKICDVVPRMAPKHPENFQ